jgi:hypothetical protein
VKVTDSDTHNLSSHDTVLMEHHALKNVNNCLNTNIYSYFETSGGQSSNPYLNVFHFLNTRADQKSVAA